MNREDIIRMAQEAGFGGGGFVMPTHAGHITHELERFAALVAKNDTSQERVDETSKNVQEPVAWWIPKYKAPDMVSKVRWSDECEPLYTTPPQRTWVEIDDDDWIKSLEMADFDKVAAFEFFEAKLKEKNEFC